MKLATRWALPDMRALAAAQIGKHGECVTRLEVARKYDVKELLPGALEEVFKGAKNQERLKRFRDRGSSALWVETGDRVTEEEKRRDLEGRERLVREGGWRYEVAGGRQEGGLGVFRFASSEVNWESGGPGDEGLMLCVL